MRLFLVLLAVRAASALYSSSDDVIELTAANFNDRVINSDSVWLVEFYAPWCGHCKSLAPEWKKAATALKGIVKVGAVDMDTHSSVGGPYNVRGFPTIKLFGANKNSPSDYQGARSADAIVQEALRVAKDTANSRLGKKGGSGGSKSKSSGGGGGSKGSTEDVVELTESNFDDEVFNGKDAWLVEFFAPWCGHCQRLAPEYAQAASELKGKMKLGAVDATVHQGLAAQYGVRGYPTLKFFPASSKTSGDAEEYNAGRTASDIISWCNQKVVANLPPPDVYEITEQSVLDTACKDHQLCLVSVLPHILDTGAVGRNQYLQTLREMGEKYKNKNWGWVWTSAGEQPKVEEALGMGGFGYPAMAALNTRKGKYSPLKGAFSKDGIGEFLRAVAVGRGSTEPVRGDGLPVVETREPWDGKDGELPEEEDIDLSDFDMDADEEETNRDEL